MKIIKQLKSNWNDYEVPFKNKLLTRTKIKYSLLKLWTDKFKDNISPDQFILIQFKVKISAGIFRSLSL